MKIMQDRWPSNDDLMRAILQHKLTKAIVMFPQDIPSTIVTRGSHVSHRIEGGTTETDDAMRGLVGLTLSITNPRRLAMLGLAEGQSVILQRPGEAAERITVEKVVYQPEAAEKGRTTAQIVHDLGPHRIEGTAIPFSPDADAPGPSIVGCIRSHGEEVATWEAELAVWENEGGAPERSPGGRSSVRLADAIANEFVV
ncbi:nucleoside-diphosphate kinase [Sinorhizobium fredii]|uniref:nucleoside-diphosphate kinase n=1 Tax=Rhizobium fredii TaxID=380 RepID=UPI003512E122